MKQYRNYPIYINFNVFDEKELEARKSQGLSAPTSKEEEWEEIKEEKNISPGALKFENLVAEKLELIYKTQLGKLLMSRLSPHPLKKVWIVPNLNDDSKMPEMFQGITYHNAFFTNSGGGIRIKFYPWEKGTEKQSSYDTDDDILFHELVHAYRQGYRGYQLGFEVEVDLNTSGEEFLALCLQNMYRSCRGDWLLYEAYNRRNLVHWYSSYEYIASKKSLLDAVKKVCLEDALIKNLSLWKMPKFNPWRDYNELSRLYAEKGR